MSEKKKRFEADLDRLIKNGELLDAALNYETSKDEFNRRIANEKDKKKLRSFVKDLPKFGDDYQAWYSEALALVKQTLPDRVEDFTSHYKYKSNRKALTPENYRIRDCLQGLERRDALQKIIVDRRAAIPEFEQQLAIVKAAKATLDSTLIDLTTLLQADLFDSETDSAEALAKAGFLRAAGAICGVVIEKHLQQVCANHNVKWGRRKPTIAVLNNALKDSQVLSIPDWRLVQGLADIRNLCDHAGAQEPTRDQINYLVEGTRKVLTTVF